MMHKTSIPLYTALLLVSLTMRGGLAQNSSLGPLIRYGDQVPPDVEQIYQRGLQFLAQTQQQDGSWRSRQQGSGITGLCLMAFLAHGEDPNFGRYGPNIRKATISIIQSQNPTTGYIKSTMYHHGFAMLALAEAYGTVDETLLWSGHADQSNRRSIGEALELAVRCTVTSHNKSNRGGWRYSPNSGDSDTSVSGAVLMGLLAARNAGIEVPDKTIDGALDYFKSCTSEAGTVAYTQGMGGFSDSMNRSAIAALVYAIGKRKDWQEYRATVEFVSERLDHQSSSHPSYFRYYMAQALFQGDFEAWSKWRRENTQLVRGMQHEDGSVDSSYDKAYGTAMALLSLALEYRFLPIYER